MSAFQFNSCMPAYVPVYMPICVPFYGVVYKLVYMPVYEPVFVPESAEKQEENMNVDEPEDDKPEDKPKEKPEEDMPDKDGKTEKEYHARARELYDEIVRAYPSKEYEANRIFGYAGDLRHINYMYHSHMLELYNQLFGTNLTF